MTSIVFGLQVPRSWFWSVAYFAALAAMVVDANLKLLDDPWHWLLKVVVVALLVPLVVSAHRRTKEEGPMSSAFEAFRFRLMAAAGGCILLFSISAGVHRSLPPESPALWLLAFVTAVPVLGIVWLMARYLAEETDEYLRHLAVTSALIGLAIVLVVATVWGFLENLGLVGHVWSWYAVPLFAVAYALGRAWLKARGR